MDKSTKDTVVHLFKEMFPGFSEAYCERVYDRMVLVKGVRFVQGEPVIPEADFVDKRELPKRVDLPRNGHFPCGYP